MPINDYTLGYIGQKGVYPVKYVASNAMLFQLGYKALVWHYMKRLREVKDKHIYLPTFVQFNREIVACENKLCFTISATTKAVLVVD